jgi:hypothetical protein
MRFVQDIVPSKFVIDDDGAQAATTGYAKSGARARRPECITTSSNRGPPRRSDVGLSFAQSNSDQVLVLFDEAERPK